VRLMSPAIAVLHEVIDLDKGLNDGAENREVFEGKRVPGVGRNAKPPMVRKPDISATVETWAF
jgi:hypothetical protein